MGWMGVEEEVDVAQEDIILAACWLLLAEKLVCNINLKN
jgi:hypothetical protein